MSQNDKLTELAEFITNLSKNLKDLEEACNDKMEELVISEEGAKIKFENSGTLDAKGIIEKMNESAEKKVEEDVKPAPSEEDGNVEGNVENNDKSAVGGGQYNFSDTSSVNGSFLNGRMNKYLRNSMTGGGRNSDTLASITELQANPMPRYNTQSGGGKMSKSDFLKRMKESGITSSTSEFC